ncbi:MAG TPA: hypothetical protein VNM90_07590 [Haliangium sp.]|nr:hypothetical protein [Haliangium sp.]
MTTSLPFALGPSTQGIPLSGGAQQMVQQAMQGGGATAAFFQNQYTVGNFVSWLNSQGESAWIQSTDDQGNPVFFAEQTSQTGNIVLLLQTTQATSTTQGARAAADDDGPPQFQWNGQSYNVVGSVTGTLTFNSVPLWWIEVPLGLSTIVPVSALSSIVWANLVKPLLTGFWNGVQSLFSDAPEITSGAEAATAADDAGTAAVVDGAAVDGAEVSMLAGGLAFAGIAVLVAIPFILMALGHPSYQNLKVYNLTNYDIDWSLDYLAHGAMNASPISPDGGNQVTANPLIPAISTIQPAPGIAPVTVAHEADFSFINTSEFAGIGYIMALTVTDTATGAATVVGALFDVPWAGENSLWGGSYTPGSGASVYDQNAGQNKVTQLVYPFTGPDGVGATLTLTYDFLSGQHPAPNGQNTFVYNSLAVFAPA